ncbi:metal ABC transporter solute-binding protein, Zn/Mn family [Desmospora profundinema]|uniref:Manganese/zinc/iron transport system substrate-binding protein n=1 Tax=Desmospora profundinema TaxID=1571184 RepID=A0ABU1INK3_9BACL|nr:zinc ABC transporter substrate-binding protein [Desmospora profundinema]MDR6226369.1 manganese/zinc/iron transport system substrate-binding protein [Desmospora profundinema]
MGIKQSRFKWLIMVCCFLIVSIPLAGCGLNGATAIPEDGPIEVTATTGMVGDIVKNVGGDRVNVTTLMGPGVDPHLYKASQGDIGKLDKAHMIFYSGLQLEGNMGDILSKLSNEKPVVPVAESIPEEKLKDADDEAYQTDPHVWFDVQLWIEAVKVVEQELSKADPNHQEEYRQRAESYIADLEELDQYAREQIQSIPEKQRVLVTAHDAFEYFGDAYGIEVVGLQGINTASEYGLRDVQRIVNLISERKVKAVFIETSVPKRSIEAVVKGAEQRGHQVEIGGELFSDAMGEEGTEEGTYIGMVRHNVDTIVSALK